MSAPPNEDYGQGQFQGQEYGQQPYDDQQSPAQPQQDAAGAPKKKKRGYAAGAFDVGAGANAAVGGQAQGGAPQYGVPPGQPAAPGYGGYPQQDPQQPAQGYQYPQQGGYQAPQQQPTYGGYQAPAPASEYPVPGTGPAPGVGGITQGMGGMNLGGQPVQPQQQAQSAAAPRPQLNQLYPTDLLNQPFNVAELDLPPPPILLPQNVSRMPCR